MQKLDNLRKWNNSYVMQFAKTHTREMDHLNRPISIREVESIINNFPKQKAPSQNTSTSIPTM